MVKEFVKKIIFEETPIFNLANVNKNEKKYNSPSYCEDFNYKYSNDNLYYKGEIALWKAVILQAFIDLQSNSKKKIANTYRIKALMWFNLKNEDFITTCNYAGLDPKYVYEKSRIVKENSKFFN